MTTFDYSRGLLYGNLRHAEVDGPSVSSKDVWCIGDLYTIMRRVADMEHLDEPDNITVWLIPNPTESQSS